MIGLIILVLVVAVLVWLAANYLPVPINWIVAAVILIAAIIAIFGSGDSSAIHCC